MSGEGRSDPESAEAAHVVVGERPVAATADARTADGASTGDPTGPAPEPPGVSASTEERADPLEAGVEAAARARAPFSRVLSLSWVPLAGATLSLILSLVAIWVSTQDPEVMLIMPEQIRVAQGRDSGSAFVYLQPAYVSTGRNDRVEVIRDMTLVVEPPSGATATFAWDEQARLVTDGAGVLSYEYVADAVPILISPRAAATPLCLFDAPDGWHFQPGRYRFTLVGNRVVASGDLRASFDLELTADDIAFLDGPGAGQFLTFPIPS